MPPKGQEKYTVGQMAALCNVSAKQLRFYDERGLIKPAYRDETNGYRYYEHWQIEEVLLLNELKQYNFSLRKIRDLLHNRELSLLTRELEHQLYELRRERERIMAKYDSIIEHILNILHSSIYLTAGGNVPAQKDISIVTFPKTIVAHTRYVSYWKADTLFISRRAELLKLISETHMEETGTHMAVFYGDYKKQFSENPRDSEGDLEICIKVKNPDLSLPCIRVIDEFRALSCIHVGHYRDMLPTYLNLEKYAKLNRLNLRNESLEEYLIGATMTSNPDNYVTRIYLPITEADDNDAETEKTRSAKR